jgi:hypothetical protein
MPGNRTWNLGKSGSFRVKTSAMSFASAGSDFPCRVSDSRRANMRPGERELGVALKPMIHISDNRTLSEKYVL